jgi:glycosyltransferase involved in cell wall biosynthesis
MGFKKASSAVISTKKNLVIMGHFDGYGGSQTAFRKLVEFALEEGHQVKVIAVSDYPERVLNSYSNKNVLGVIPHHTGGIWPRLKKMLRLANICFSVKFSDYDSFITVGFNNSANLLAGFFPKKCFKIGQDFIANRSVNDPILLKSQKILDGIALQAPAMLAYYKKLLPDIAGLNWLPCFPEPPINDVKHKNIYKKGDIVKLAYFGRIAGNKGIDLVMRALAASEMLQNLHIDIWGKGEEELRLKELNASLNLEGRVKFMGSYPNGKAGAEQMASYDCLILCSTRTEGLPLILLEAMAYGLPLMATDIGAICDCCIDNPDAILVQPNERDISNGLAEVYQRVINHSFNSDRQVDFYNKNFSYEVMADRWRTCLEDPQSFFYAK